MGRHRVRRRAATTLAAAVAWSLLTGTLGAPSGAAHAPQHADDDVTLYLVTLVGPGTSRTTDVLPPAVLREWMLGTQDQVLASVDAEKPVYRWTTALSGFAVRLTDEQARTLTADPRVALVERDRMLRLAGTAAPATGPVAAREAGSRAGGRGTVIGFVDSGIAPEGPVFADVPGLGPAPAYAGECRVGPDWPASACTTKVVGAQWFVDGFGADGLRDSASLSARDDVGHGTAVASVAAGNRGLTARVRGQRLGAFSGVAPQARVAAYKACWTAPDPDDDGCSAADVVSAVDRATADGVDVLNVSVAEDTGRDPARDPAQDTVQRALLGAAEADIVVVAASGNGHRGAVWAAPWTTTVGATTGVVRRGVVGRRGAPALPGVMVSARPAGPARLVLAADVRAAGAKPGDARACALGSLDAAKVAGRIVLCERGKVARTDKSLAVQQADGVGMVLANRRPGSLDPDLHAVPTVHVDQHAGRDLRRWLGRHRVGRVTLRPQGTERVPPRVAGWSRSGDPASGVLSPDLLAVGTGVLAADLPGSSRWQLVSGTSVAAAQVSGAAAVLLGRRDWSAVEVRSALAGTARAVGGRADGAGLVRPDLAASAPLAVQVASTDYRGWLDGRRAELGTGPLVLGPDRRTTTRTVTNLTRRTRTFTARVLGLPGLRLSRTSVTLPPGGSATVTLRLEGPPTSVDTGVVEWRAAPGDPVVRWRLVEAR